MTKPLIVLLSFLNFYLFFLVQISLKNHDYYHQNFKKIVLKEIPLNKIIVPKKLVFTNENKNFFPTKFPHPNYILAKAGALFILEDNEVLWTKNAKDPYPIASLTKIITSLRLFEIIKEDKQINLQLQIPITTKAKKTASSSFLNSSPYKSLPLKTLMHSIMFRSANDSAQLVADYFSQRYKLPFNIQMNKFAFQNDCKSARFFNAHGLPGNYKKQPDNIISVEHLAILTKKILLENPIVIEWTKRSQHKYFHNSKIISKNTNSLTAELPKITGLKTGYTANAGFCLVLSWKFKNKTCVAIILGCQNSANRTTLAKNIFLWTNRYLASRK